MLSTSTFDPGVVCSSVANLARYLRALNCCGRWPQRTMAAEGRKESLCDLSNVVASGHNELWRPKAANSLSVTLKMLWPLATTNLGGRWPQMICFLLYFGHKSGQSGNPNEQSLRSLQPIFHCLFYCEG